MSIEVHRISLKSISKLSPGSWPHIPGAWGYTSPPPIIWYHPLQYLKIYPSNSLMEKSNKNYENKQEICMVVWKPMLILRFYARFLGKLLVRPKKVDILLPMESSIKNSLLWDIFPKYPPILNTDLRP